MPETVTDRELLWELAQKPIGSRAPLGLTEIPDGCDLPMDEEVEIVVSALGYELRDEWDDDDLSDEKVSPDALREAIQALRDDDKRLAMVLFHSVFDTLSPELDVIERALLQRAA